MNWTWKGDYFPLNRGEYEILKRDLENEVVKTKEGDRNFSSLRPDERGIILKQRVKKYCERAYKRIHVSMAEERKDTVCMRENSFYVDTVRAFRDRRYEYKNSVKTWKGKFDEAAKRGDRAKAEELENIVNTFESLQLAHKIILNSFYGYVMRRGARWYSMQMAGMVTYLGGKIITYNREFLERVGIPLELDTDGIWCLFPQSFPENYGLTYTDGKKGVVSYPCALLNMHTYNTFANHQYQVLKKETHEYTQTTEMSVFFEIDGPYRCIMLPAAREEGKMLKKKYAVYNLAGKVQELKGFEMKRRGELNIVKIFQSEVFQKFIDGHTLEDCYKACAEVAERWYDVLDSEGSLLSNAELIEYIGEERRLSKSVTGYGTQKSTALTCARRLGEFLGIDVTKDKGLNTKFIIAKKPMGKSIAERAIPTAIFTADLSLCRKYLRSWLKDDNLTDCSMKTIVDWEYYKERLAKTIQKLVTIPAVLQGLANPFPKVAHPEWLKKKLKESKEGQRKLDHFLVAALRQPDLKPLALTLGLGIGLPPGSTSATANANANPASANGAGNQLPDLEDLGAGYNQSEPTPMEDLQPTPAAALVSSKPEVHRSKAGVEADAATQRSQEAEQLQTTFKQLVSGCPLPLENFEGWLQQQQSLWKIERQLGVGTMRGTETRKGLISYLKMQEETVGKSLWHVLNISELPSNPGYLKVWFIAEHEDRTRSKQFNLFPLCPSSFIMPIH